jgi:hypothetical protein
VDLVHDKLSPLDTRSNQLVSPWASLGPPEQIVSRSHVKTGQDRCHDSDHALASFVHRVSMVSDSLDLRPVSEKEVEETMAIESLGPVRSVSGFLSVVNRLRSNWPQDNDVKSRGDERALWFRGQEEASWGLSPKLHRPEYRKADENEIRHEFQSRGLQLIQGRMPTTQYEWYFLMQHYEVPTRLLDWTDNPLMALFFSIYEKKSTLDAVVWVVDPWWLNAANKALKKKKIEGPLLSDWEEAGLYLPDLENAFAGVRTKMKFPAAIDPPHVDRRLAVQGSHFMIFGTERDLADMELTEKKKARLAKIIISGRAIKTIESELENLGIHVATVFPDLIALGKYLKLRWTRTTDVADTKTKKK